MSVRIEGNQCTLFPINTLNNEMKCRSYNNELLSSCHTSCHTDRQTPLLRQVTNSGYLFVAPPDCDFSQQINRSKRWQRRWFKLYEDGHLSYCLDEDPETVPQEVMNMNNVEEVIDADELTGNEFAIGLKKSSNDMLFIKGTSFKEKKWWFDALSRFPKLSSRHGNKSRAKNGINPFKVSPTTKITSRVKPNINSCVKESDDKRQEEEQQPVLWLCFATRLGLKHFTKETECKEANSSLPDSHEEGNMKLNKNKNNKNINNLLNSNHTVNLSKKDITRGSLIEDTTSSVNQDSQHQNWIHSNLSKTSSSMTGLQDLQKKLQQTREELKKINKELRESYANYDHLEIAYEKLCQQVSKLEEVRQSEINLMRHRINDLTVKLTSSERILRQTQLRLTKSQGKSASRKTTNSCSEEGPPAGSFLLEKTTLTVHPMNKNDSETADQEEIQDKSENDSSLSSPTTSEKMMVIIDCSQHESMLSRLHDLSSCVRKISDSLNSYCDTSNQEKHHHRSLSSILPNLEEREMIKMTNMNHE